MSLHAYKNSNLPLVLLYDSEYMVRSVFALLANQTAKASVMETAHLPTANNLCQTNAFELMIIGIGEEEEEKHFIELIRNGMTLSDKGVPIVVMASAVTEGLLYELKSLNVTDVLLKPTRIKTIHDVFLRNISQLIPGHLQG